MAKRGVLLLVAVGAALAIYFAIRPDMCDGLPREIGACSNDRPVFTGQTCAEVGAEWGVQLDDRVTSLMAAPPRSGQSSQLLDIEILTIQLANKHMRDNGITPSCTVEVFWEAGESQFSERFRSGVGDLMYEGIDFEGADEPTYETWSQRSVEMVNLILKDPHLPS